MQTKSYRITSKTPAGKERYLMGLSTGPGKVSYNFSDYPALAYVFDNVHTAEIFRERIRTIFVHTRPELIALIDSSFIEEITIGRVD